MAVVYEGTTSNPLAVLSNADTLTINVLQNVYDNSPGTFDGLYTENVPVTISGAIGTGSSVTANLFYDGQGVGQVGPFVGAGNYNGSASAYLPLPGRTDLTGDYLYEDFQFIYDFAPGTDPGAGGGTPFANENTPEPAETLPMALAFGLLICVTLKGTNQWTKKPL
jgi:hypothetical protein